MVDFLPFRGVRYDTAIAGPMDRLICPPYDVISPAHERALLARSPHNMVRLELAELPGPASAERYLDAAKAYAEMQARGTLRTDDEPAYYLLRQRFEVDGRQRERLGLLGALRLEELGQGVLPHEDTASGPKEDRLALMEATAANFSPLMMLYRDPHGLVAQVLGAARTQTPDADFEVDDEGFSLWRIADRGAVSTITAAVGPQPVYIADGHHRYETALTYRATHPEADTVLTCLIAFDDPGLLIQPYYRVVHGLSDNQLGALRNLLATLFESRPADVEGAAALDAAVAVAGRDQVALGVVQQDEPPALLTLSEEEVPSPANGNGTPAEQARTVEAVVLQEMLLRPVIGDAFPEHMAYVHDPEEALSMVARGEGQVAFFIKGVPPDVFEVVVGAGIRLPRKSTYFHPKLPSGLVVSPLSA